MHPEARIIPIDISPAIDRETVFRARISYDYFLAVLIGFSQPLDPRNTKTQKAPLFEGRLVSDWPPKEYVDLSYAGATTILR
jgi:hypothetical protein